MKPNQDKNEMLRLLIEDRNQMLKKKRTCEVAIARLNRGIKAMESLEGVTVKDDALPVLKGGRKMKAREILAVMAPDKEMAVEDIADAMMGKYTEAQINACMTHLFHAGRVDHVAPTIWKLRGKRRGG